MSTGLAKTSLRDLLSMLKLEVCGSSSGTYDRSRRHISQKHSNRAPIRTLNILSLTFPVRPLRSTSYFGRFGHKILFLMWCVESVTCGSIRIFPHIVGCGSNVFLEQTLYYYIFWSRHYIILFFGVDTILLYFLE